MAYQNLNDHIRGSKYHPTIHEIVKENENVVFKRKREQSLQLERQDEERKRMAVSPPWVRLGISRQEYEDQLLLKGEENE